MKKNIIMIGGSRGIGQAILQQIHQDNNVYVASRTDDNLKLPNTTHIPFDALSDKLNLSLLPEEIHGFVYCPGSISLKPFKMLNSDDFEADMQINFISLVKVVNDIMPRMTAASSMVFFSTVAVGTGMPYHTSVAASKGAVEGFTKALAAEYAPRIRVNAIAPSLVDTDLAGRLLNNDKKRALMAERHPLKRVGTAEDIANAAVYLLSSKSSWMTGQIFSVDGGISSLKSN
ncbi:SDR family NAD(P)-dependent oxidoreductase [Muriicola sp. Z0-33]|uniref:SDR family NAD(P)-dependent oxidoreductase n=1 Tax=Muriicola sp. Z0-33 TaxID=2816957 RepID=UPI002238B907|nr:SDR family NAD(P)-dependent oxidoreductase [Muriicola sp. Z0-33]MCW5515524.1 SDR family oxidoreductase [Muriicola sp. Z0-33]